jgi:hypothetical protein
MPFTDADFESYTTWPFETMVFPKGSRRGLYHAPYATRQEAVAGHQLMVETIKKNLEFGGGVNESGNPLITPEEWRSRLTR